MIAIASLFRRRILYHHFVYRTKDSATLAAGGPAPPALRAGSRPTPLVADRVFHTSLRSWEHRTRASPQSKKRLLIAASPLFPMVNVLSVDRAGLAVPETGSRRYCRRALARARLKVRPLSCRICQHLSLNRPRAPASLQAGISQCSGSSRSPSLGRWRNASVPYPSIDCHVQQTGNATIM